MALGKALVDRQGESHAMAGLLPIATSFAEPRLHLGYRRIRLLAPSPLGQAGTTYRGHEFHYASLIEADGAPPLFEISDARQQPLGQSGARLGAVCGSFLHLIDRTSEPADDLGPARHLRLVDN
jgi:cobyrinic acid a,c-diamide synthase